MNIVMVFYISSILCLLCGTGWTLWNRWYRKNIPIPIYEKTKKGFSQAETGTYDSDRLLMHVADDEDALEKSERNFLIAVIIIILGIGFFAAAQAVSYLT